MERGRGRHRRGGGGGRRRPWCDRGSGGDREAAHSARGRRGGPRERTEPAVPRTTEEENDAEPKEEDEVSSGFSRRKILSNWDRYQEPEKESESKVLQRGTDYSVLLSSAGDAFTQFRFAEEREWGTEDPNSMQTSAAYLDSQSLVRVLQELPLYLRLNVEADLVQDELPQELPQFKLKGISSMPTSLPKLPFIEASAGSTQETCSVPEPCTQYPTKAPQDTLLPELEEELDFLLSLEAPVREETGSQTAMQPPIGNEDSDLQGTCEGHEPPPVIDDGSATADKDKAVTPEDLEDWLDSMIS
ncbi:cell death regulator Aven [Rhinophrynus dorsalis]